MATVLVVDDNEGVRKIATIILKQTGHAILEASNGLEALIVYSSYRQNIDLVLTDVDMPQIDGIELAGRIRARDPSKRILLMSGWPGNRCQGSEVYPMLSKPFRPNQLIEAVDRMLNV